MAEEQQQSNITPEYNTASVGMNMDNSINQVPKGALTYALNAAVENFDSNSINYQNEPGNEFCLQFPIGFQLIGEHFINEQNKHIFFITNPNTGESQIGYMDNNDCQYHIYVDAPCLNFNVNHPIHKTVHKITNCTTEIYWTDGFNPRRYLDLGNIPYTLKSGTALCNPEYTTTVDCNQLKLQPNFNIPQLDIIDITTGGDLVAGTYQFAIQYADPNGNPYTSYYSVTNPTPIANPQLTTPNFNYQVGKSIVVNVSNLDATGQFQYFNLAVIKTVNDITSVELTGTYYISNTTLQITYTGQNVTNIRLAIADVFEKFPYYEIAQDLTAVQDLLVWDNLTSIDRINYQSIASQINLLWESYRIPATEDYADELNATNLRGYLRDEVYAFEIVFLLRNGKQTDGFHIPGRVRNYNEISRPNILDTNPDFIGEPEPGTNYSPYWKIYNTADVVGASPSKSSAVDYKGPWEYGRFAYWESTELYPCNEAVWGELSGQPIRHHKFPDILVSPAVESKIFTSSGGMAMGNDAVFPIGVRIDSSQIATLIEVSNLTQDQKDDIVAYKIIRGNRGTNKSIVAKGILRNVGKYNREGTDYYYPNYPYNDLRDDPFLNVTNNAWSKLANSYDIIISKLEPALYGGQPYAEVEYTDVNTNRKATKKYYEAGPRVYKLCSIGFPRMSYGEGLISYSKYDVWQVGTFAFQVCAGWRGKWTNIYGQTESRFFKGAPFYKIEEINIKFGTTVECYENCDPCCFVYCVDPKIKRYDRTVGVDNCVETPLPINSNTTDSKYRHVFNSPETSFGQPFLGDYLKLENVMFGRGRAHFVEVKKNAMYKLITEEAQRDALGASNSLAAYTGTWSAQAMFAAYQAYLTIYVNGITRRNYAYSYNSIADYNYNDVIENNLGIKQRPLDIAQYIIPGVQSVGDNHVVNNWNRESSVYLKTKESVDPLPFPDKTPSIAPGGLSFVTDESRATISSANVCATPAQQNDISVVSYYASIKNIAVSQWGQMYSYETLDTGFQRSLINIPNVESEIFFGGDTFISRFAFKTKLPFFIDNRVGAPDDSDIFYDEIGNIAYPKYWHSARSVLSDFNSGGGVLPNIISYKANNFDCPNSQLPGPPANNPNRTFYNGYFYLFAYGIPNVYCETSYNTDLRQAFNNKEGDFWPHVNTDIPDDWLQESFVTILQDNTYYYNVTFSKQNKENYFSHLPQDWKQQLCFTNYPFRAIYSEAQSANADNRVNSWLIYRPIAAFDFPQNYGKLISLDGIQNRAVLARFENKSLLYNTLLTINTSNPQAAYLGNDTLFKSSPPIDFAETDLGYVGSQNKMLLKIPQGQISVDAKRGQVFLIAGNQATDLSAFGSGMNRFFTDHLAFEILRHFPNVDVDNHFNGVGLHGVFDSKYDRVIISKLDYIPLSKDIKYDPETNEFYIEEEIDCVPITTTTTTTRCPCNNYVFVGGRGESSFEFVECGATTSITIDVIDSGSIMYCVNNNYPILKYGSGDYYLDGNPANCCVPITTSTSTSTSTSSTTTSSTTTAIPTVPFFWQFNASGSITANIQLQDFISSEYIINETLSSSSSGAVGLPIMPYNLTITWQSGGSQPIKFRLCDSTTGTEIYYINNIGAAPTYTPTTTLSFTPILGHVYSLQVVNGAAEPSVCVII
jgi:hypothetical protein